MSQILTYNLLHLCLSNGNKAIFTDHIVNESACGCHLFHCIKFYCNFMPFLIGINTKKPNQNKEETLVKKGISISYVLTTSKQ